MSILKKTEEEEIVYLYILENNKPMRIKVPKIVEYSIMNIGNRNLNKLMLIKYMQHFIIEIKEEIIKDTLMYHLPT